MNFHFNHHVVPGMLTLLLIRERITRLPVRLVSTAIAIHSPVEEALVLSRKSIGSVAKNAQKDLQVQIFDSILIILFNGFKRKMLVNFKTLSTLMP